MSDQDKHSKFRVFFRFRLWMIFVLFVPAAFYAKQLGQRIKVGYTEERELLWNDGDQEIVFAEQLSDGSIPTTGRNMHKAYESAGVSFSFGTPVDLEKLKRPGEQPASEVVWISKSPNIDQSNFSDAGKGQASSATLNATASSSKVDGGSNIPQQSGSGFIGISGYRFKFPNANFPNSIAPIDNSGRYMKRFVGQTTIRFHQPGNPAASAGVHRVGFFAARLDHPHTLQATLYSPTGRLLARQTNVSHKCVFMGFQSNKKIGWIEIETVGDDQNYAIGNLIFDQIK